MKYSIIVPCYNVSEYLDDCLSSLVNQTIGPESLEIILVDDCSTDDGMTLNKLMDWEKRYPDQIILIPLSQNMRQGGARNIGIGYATGDYITFVDADDWVNIHYLSVIDQIVAKLYPDIIQIKYTGRMEKDDEYLSPPATDAITYHTFEDDEKRKWLAINDAVMNQGCIKFYKRDLIEKAGVRFAEKTSYEEPLFTYPLKFYLNSIVRYDNPVYYYRYNEKGTTAHLINSSEKLYEHMHVQEQVWDFLKNTEFFNLYYDEIELYFLHSFYYETECFAKARGFTIDTEMRRYMIEGLKKRGIRYLDNPYLLDEYMKEERELFLKIDEFVEG